MIRVITVVLLLVAVMLGGVLAYRSFGSPLSGVDVPTRPQIPNVQLIGDDGKTRTLPDSNGLTRVVFFGFTRCPDVCPATLGVLARAYENLSARQQQKLQVMLVSVDPDHDSPAQLRDYLDRFNEDFVGLTGEDSALKVLQKSFFVYAHDDHNGGIAHGDTVALVDAQGRIRRVYTQQDVTQGKLSRDLPRLADGRF